MKSRIVLFVVFFTVTAAYVPMVLRLDYVWDDWQLFINRPDLRSLAYLPQAWFEPILPGTTYFRPLVLATFSAEFLCYGIAAELSHAVNFFIFLINIFLVYKISKKLQIGSGGKQPVFSGAISAIFYGVHPALVESTAWVSGRFDCLATMFILLAINLCINRLTGWNIIKISVLYGAGLLSKEMAVLLPIFILIVFRIQYSSLSVRDFIRVIGERVEVKLFLSLGIILVLYVVARYQAFGQIYHSDATIKDTINFSRHVAFVGQTFLFYIKMALWPFSDINPQHPLDLSSVDPRWIIMGWIWVLAISLGIIYIISFCKKKAAWMILLFIVSMAPVLNIIPLTIGGNIGHERFMTMPLAFFAMGISFVNVPKKVLSPKMLMVAPFLIASLTSVWLFICFVNIRITVPLWTNNLSLWSWAYAKHPDFQFVKISYLSALTTFRRFDDGDKLVANMANDDDPKVVVIRGLYLIRRGKSEEGVKILEKINDNFPKYHLALGEMRPGADERKIMGLSLIWLYQGYFSALAEGYNSLRRFPDALRAVDAALFYAPNYPPALLQKSFSLFGLDKVKEGEEFYEKAKAYIVPSGRKDLPVLKNEFINKLCSIDQKNYLICNL